MNVITKSMHVRRSLPCCNVMFRDGYIDCQTLPAVGTLRRRNAFKTIFTILYSYHLSYTCSNWRQWSIVISYLFLFINSFAVDDCSLREYLPCAPFFASFWMYFLSEIPLFTLFYIFYFSQKLYFQLRVVSFCQFVCFSSTHFRSFYFSWIWRPVFFLVFCLSF